LGQPEPTLIVVTKNHPVELAAELFRLGERNFGENRVQEALPKASALEHATGENTVNWHLIGQLQSNKVKQALEFADSIHSLDRDGLLDELIKRTADRSKPLEVFIQINLTLDETRGGLQESKLLDFAARVAATNTLDLVGLMAVASLDAQPEFDFERMARLSDTLQREHKTATGLSIGMSNDYLQALQFGATHLRIGTAITGNRQY
jgi:pyridoxal phosphate enzyme (YggS family)